AAERNEKAHAPPGVRARKPAWGCRPREPSGAAHPRPARLAGPTRARALPRERRATLAVTLPPVLQRRPLTLLLSLRPTGVCPVAHLGRGAGKALAGAPQPGQVRAPGVSSPAQAREHKTHSHT